MTALRVLSQEIAGGGEQEGPDPLIALKQQEIEIKGQRTAADIANDQAKFGLDEQKLQERSRQFDDRLESQEGQTAARIEASDRRELMRLRQKEGRNP